MVELLYTGHHLQRTLSVCQYYWTMQGICERAKPYVLLLPCTLYRIVNGDINPKDNEGMTPVHCTAQMGTSKHVVQLIEGKPVLQSLLIRRCSVANCDFSDVDIEGKTALHWTVENKDLSCLHTIVEYYPHLLNKQYVILNWKNLTSLCIVQR